MMKGNLSFTWRPTTSNPNLNVEVVIMKQITMMNLITIRRWNTKAKQISLAMKEISFYVMDVNNGI